MNFRALAGVLAALAVLGPHAVALVLAAVAVTAAAMTVLVVHRIMADLPRAARTVRNGAFP